MIINSNILWIIYFIVWGTSIFVVADIKKTPKILMPILVGIGVIMTIGLLMLDLRTMIISTIVAVLTSGNYILEAYRSLNRKVYTQ